MLERTLPGRVGGAAQQRGNDVEFDPQTQNAANKDCEVLLY